jgi:putative ABC transport system ATP-binding protein
MSPRELPRPRLDAGSTAEDDPIIRLEHVTKSYPQGDRDVVALDDVCLEVPGGEFVAIMGRSGSGKSTLLNLVAGIDVPTAGRVLVAGRDLTRMSDTALTAMRRTEVGIVFQFFNLLGTLNIRENVALPALLGGEKPARVWPRVDALLDRVELAHRARSRPHELSGGELQRTALARAVIHSPRVVLADEPTGNLDSRTAEQVLVLLRELAGEEGATVLLVTHSAEAATYGDRVLQMRDGRFVGEP